MKQYFEIFKELWSMPRYRALMKIGMYIIFFTFVILYIRASQNVTYKEPTTNDRPIINSNSDYNTVITYNGKTYDYTKTEDLETLKINNVVYDINLNILDNNGTRPEEEFDVKFWRFNPSFINELVENSEEDFVTKFKDGSTEKGYSIKMRFIFENINSGLDLKPGKDYNTEIFRFKVLEENKEIKKVVLDVTNYKDMFVDVEGTEEVIIEYK